MTAGGNTGNMKLTLGWSNPCQWDLGRGNHGGGEDLRTCKAGMLEGLSMCALKWPRTKKVVVERKTGILVGLAES